MGDRPTERPEPYGSGLSVGLSPISRSPHPSAPAGRDSVVSGTAAGWMAIHRLVTGSGSLRTALCVTALARLEAKYQAPRVHRYFCAGHTGGGRLLDGHSRCHEGRLA